MTRSSRKVLGGLVLLIVCALAYVALRFALARIGGGADPDAVPHDLAAVAQFESARRADSLRHAAHTDSLHAAWDAQRAERAANRAVREARQAAYADSQRVWAARRARWAAEREERQARRDSLRAARPTKLPRGTVIDANTADTLMLQRIPGIGPVKARRIVAYRTALGGFATPDQLAEIPDLPHGIAAWFTVTSPTLRRIAINRADFRTLVRHPYLTADQARAVITLRRSAPLRGWQDLRGNALFTEADISRLTPYVQF